MASTFLETPTNSDADNDSDNDSETGPDLDVLWDCLTLMPNLQEISLRLHESTSLALSPATDLIFNSTVPRLPTVHAISIYPGSEPESWDGGMSMFLDLTPNIKKASIDILEASVDQCPLLLALAQQPNLEYLMLCRMTTRPRFNGETMGWGVLDIPGMHLS